MLRYLHVQAEPIMRIFSKLTISHGNYNLLLHNDVPIYSIFLLNIFPTHTSLAESSSLAAYGIW